ncbi:phosphoglycerate mutase [Gonapodya prolifera JEL478]|uniref:Phosphoglycerate mutase n=1 Tax=Gonapodya prolifera (strain JEL478) TaxID=1344416 RepID=A0A139AWI6_GONPJ|nr:phosphoglycerate mutase [Gonapodya prolifera JEL478]|eukprot:KXS21088.1 phosphoglycerate mutase [Gonapodya prolifera JEL478]
MPSRTRILLVRHGATELSAEDRFAGSTNVALSETGIAQAKALGKRLATVPIAAVYASPMHRCITTAKTILAERSDIDPLGVETMEGLKEIDHGKWAGKTRDEVQSQFAEEYKEWDSDPFTYAPPGGETGLSVLNRSLPCIRKIAKRHPGETVLVVSHKATIRLLIGSFLGFDLRRYRDHLDQQPCCLNIVDMKIADGLVARLQVLNDTSHYDHITCLRPHESRLSSQWADEGSEAKQKAT